MNTLFITGGQFVASVIDGVFANVPRGWRYMLGIAAIPAAIQVGVQGCGVGLGRVPSVNAACVCPSWSASCGSRSPRATWSRLGSWTRYLHVCSHPAVGATGRSLAARRTCCRAQAARVIAQARNAPVQSGVVQAELDGIKAALQSRTVPIWVAIRSVSVRRALVLGCGLQALQQVLGINTVMYVQRHAVLPRLVPTLVLTTRAHRQRTWPQVLRWHYHHAGWGAQPNARHLAGRGSRLHQLRLHYRRGARC